MRPMDIVYIFNIFFQRKRTDVFSIKLLKPRTPSNVKNLNLDE